MSFVLGSAQTAAQKVILRLLTAHATDPMQNIRTPFSEIL